MTTLVEVSKDIRICENLVGGTWKKPGEGLYQDVLSPYTGKLIGKVALSQRADVEDAVAKAAAAFPGWRNTPIKERSQILFRFRELLLAHLDSLGNTAALESGKTVAEGKAGILKGVEVLEFALSLQNLEAGGVLEVSRGVSCEMRREPLGVVAGIVPFNFPAMVPLWMYPIALALGNVFVLKPSEKVPLTSSFIAELIAKAGFPPGVFSVVNGKQATVEALIDNPAVKAVAFVGSTPVARSVYARATSLGKRALCLGGAKNFLMVVPDADPSITAKGVLDSFTGCAGQRCMAASLMIAVGAVDPIIQKIVENAKALPIGTGMGAIIDKAALTRIESCVETAAEEGAKILVDGRRPSPPKGYEGGNWLAPTIIDHARPQMACARDEIFGPVLTIMRAKTLGEAMQLENASPFGNATSIFTTSGAVAKYVTDHATSGMLGINIGVPVPREPFSFGGTKESKFGQGDITGMSSLDFWSNLKKVTTKWTQQSDANWMS